MPASRLVRPGRTPDRVLAEDGTALTPPDDWVLVPPGDPALTRRIKAAGESWTVQELRGRKTFSRGVWAPRATVERLRLALEAERATATYQRKLDGGRERREREQQAYVTEFTAALRHYLCFAPRYAALEEKLARAVANHATPVGSGTVARTQRIALDRRVEAAVIAWMRHQTTAYERLVIPRVKGMRAEVRALLAARSRELLGRYRRGEPIPPDCPLQRALAEPTS
jgi:hypothetical protein